MQTYKQVKETAELALLKGEYYFCIEFLSPLIESYPLSSKEGVNLRTIIITAFCGINKKEEAKKFCNQLLKSYDYKTRENAKYLMQIIDSPEIKKPDNWNIILENNSTLKKNSLNPLNPKRVKKDQKKFINITATPTGETKPFQKGFILIIFLIFFSLIPLLSGCVKIQNTLDLSELDAINNYLKLESNYINKFPWQIKFEENMKNIFPDAEINKEVSGFYLTKKNLDFEKSKEVLKKVIKTAGELAGYPTNLEINFTENDYIFLKKKKFRIDLDLQNLPKFEDLELTFRIINPNKTSITSEVDSHLEISKNLILWNLIPGKINVIEFSFWIWNKLFIGISLISLLMIIAYFLKLYRYKIGTDLPQLPPN